MSKNFCLLIPSKILQSDKNFSENLQQWLKININENFTQYYSLSNLKEFEKRSDIHLDIPPEFYNRYHVLDFKFYFPETQLLQSLLSWLADIYIYGDVGLLVYWPDPHQLYPTITLDRSNTIISELSVKNLTLDKIFFVFLKDYQK